MSFILDSEELKSGLIIFRRADVQHRNWYCRVRLPKSDRYKVVSLKTADREAAREKAFDYDADVRFRLKHDVPIFNRPFSEIAADYLKKQEERAEIGEISKERALGVATTIRTLNCYVGSHQIHLIGQDKWDGYVVWRRKFGKRPSTKLSELEKQRARSPKLAVKDSAEDDEASTTKAKPKAISSWTIRKEMIVFRSIMAYAAKRKFIPSSHIFEGKALLAEERREEFTREEYRSLHTDGRSWVRAATTERGKWWREMTYNFMLVMCNTGMRPPEAKNLLWRDVSFTTIRKKTKGKENKSPEIGITEVKQLEKIQGFDKAEAKAQAKSKDIERSSGVAQEERKIVILNVRGKDKARRLVAPSSVADYLERIRAIAKVTGPDDHVFSTFEGERAAAHYTDWVRALLVYAELLVGPAGTERSSYCFRHTYATLRLSEGVDSIFLAEQMGTSVQILEDHYGHIHPVKNADRILLGMQAWELPEAGEQKAPGNAAEPARVNKGAAKPKSIGPKTRNKARMN